MRLRAIVVAGCCVVSSLAVADPSAPELQAQGEDLAKQGRFSEAIDQFKAADRIEQTATHACLIALAYTRRELWPQAEIWLSLCQVRANTNDPLPDWAAAEQDQINQRLAAANVAAVEIEVVPAGAGAKLTVSSFAPDEQFAPRTIHLPPGMHQIIASAAGYPDAHQQVEIKDKTPQHVVIKLDKPSVAPPPAPPAGPHASKVPWIVIGAGGALAVVGGALHVFYYKPAYDTLNQYAKGMPMADYAKYTANHDAWATARAVTIGVYAAGAATLTVGVILKYTVYKHRESPPAISIAPTPGGGMVSVGFSR